MTNIDLSAIATAVEQVRGDIDLHKLNYESADPAGHAERLADHLDDLLPFAGRMREALASIAQFGGTEVDRQIARRALGVVSEGAPVESAEAPNA
jgi:hypothetical protein